MCQDPVSYLYKDDDQCCAVQFDCKIHELKHAITWSDELLDTSYFQKCEERPLTDSENSCSIFQISGL